MTGKSQGLAPSDVPSEWAQNSDENVLKGVVNLTILLGKGSKEKIPVCRNGGCEIPVFFWRWRNRVWTSLLPTAFSGSGAALASGGRRAAPSPPRGAPGVGAGGAAFGVPAETSSPAFRVRVQARESRRREIVSIKIATAIVATTAILPARCQMPRHCGHSYTFSQCPSPPLTALARSVLCRLKFCWLYHSPKGHAP